MRTLLWLRGGSRETALAQFDEVLRKHKQAFKDRRARELYEGIHIRRAFVLGDIGRWKEAMAILENIKSPQEHTEGIAFYLGHSYLSSHDYGLDRRTAALDLLLPSSTEGLIKLDEALIFVAAVPCQG